MLPFVINIFVLSIFEWPIKTGFTVHKIFSMTSIAPDKAAYCVFTQFRERENAIKFISVRTKTQ